jgi:polysaccharide pyruvyl transferase WcaK-like protein
LNPKLEFIAGSLYKKAFEKCDFVVFRERNSLKRAFELTGSNCHYLLAPDPAFALQPSSQAKVQEFLETIRAYRDSRHKGRAIIGVTVCENSVVFRCSHRRIASMQRKKVAHSQLLADLLDFIIETRDVGVLFLPHCIEPGVGNDVEVAKKIRSLMKSPETMHAVIEGDYSSGLLKGIIRAVDFMIGERTHSLIGSVSVATPFWGITNTFDRRTHDILGDMCECESVLADIDDPSFGELSKHMLECFDQRITCRKKLKAVSSKLSDELLQVAAMIKGKLNLDQTA